MITTWAPFALSRSTQGGPGSVYPGVYKSLCDSIDKLNEEKFGIKASESTRLPWQIMF